MFYICECGRDVVVMPVLKKNRVVFVCKCGCGTETRTWYSTDGCEHKVTVKH